MVLDVVVSGILGGSTAIAIDHRPWRSDWTSVLL
jgi:hypothetical protein